MRKIFGSLLGSVLGLVSLCAAASTPAVSESSTAADFGNLRKGNLKVGGSFYFTQSFASAGESTASVSVSVPVEYFVCDRLSLGGRVGYSHVFRTTSFDNSTYNIGPSLTYYFGVRDRLAPFVSTAVEYNKYALTSYYFDWASAFGVSYFFTPSVAISPALQYYHLFGRDNLGAFNSITLLASFSIHL